MKKTYENKKRNGKKLTFVETVIISLISFVLFLILYFITSYLIKDFYSSIVRSYLMTIVYVILLGIFIIPFIKPILNKKEKQIVKVEKNER